MATIRLVPSTYAVSNSTVTVSNASNMYANVDSTNYATITHTTSGTTSYYLYLRGFDFDSVPINATVTSVVVKIRGYESGLATSTSYAPRLYNSTSTISGASAASENFGTSTKTITVPYTGTWATLKGYGENLGIRLTVRRNNRNTQCYIYVYGAEIEVTYTIPTANVTINNSTSATVTASDTTPGIGDDVVITSSTISDIVVKDNGVDVTNQFVQLPGGTVSAVPDSNFTTGFSASGANFYQSSSTTSTSWLEYAIGHSAESPYSTSNTSNTYVKPESSTGWINYEFDFSDIPLAATITSTTVKVYGARENATVDSTHVARFQCYSGNTAKGTIQNFTSTSNSLVTVSDPGTWTVSELQDAQLRFEIGYYGGRMLGITWTVVYEVRGYIYTITAIAGDHTITVTPAASTIPVTGVSLNKQATSIQEGSTEQLTATVAPSNATDQSVSWTSSNTSVATVNSSGLVTAVSAGSATITVTTTDGSKTATCAVTVTQAATVQYRLTNTMVAGKSYLISNGNSGSVYLLSNEANGSRTLKGVAATVTDGIVSITSATAAKCLFACVETSAGNSVTTGLMIDGKYLYCDNASGLRMNTVTTLDRFWHYQDNKFWQFKNSSSNGYSDTSSEYKYYLTWSNGNATDSHVDTAGIENSTIPLTYLYEEYVPSTDALYVKINGSWASVNSAYVKQNGTWVQTDISQVFQSGVNYVKGN